MSSSSNKPLTKDLLLSKCKTDKLIQIKNVNLWGNDLDDLSILAELPNVEIVSLSLNKISSLRDFQNCNKLQELYLRKNQINDLQEVQYLQKLPNLRVLWLSHNPCAEQTYYRPYVIKLLPNLVKLDNAEITNEERQQSRIMNFDSLFMDSQQQQQPQLQKKPSQISVLQQNNSIQNSQAQSVQSKSPFKGEQQQLKKLQVEQKPITSQYQQQISSQQQQVLKKQPTSQSNRPGSALNERSSSIVSSVSGQSQQVQEQRNENILCAVLALLKELGESELELVKRDIEKKLVLKQQH